MNEAYAVSRFSSGMNSLLGWAFTVVAAFFFSMAMDAAYTEGKREGDKEGYEFGLKDGYYKTKYGFDTRLDASQSRQDDQTEVL